MAEGDKADVEGGGEGDDLSSESEEDCNDEEDNNNTEDDREDVKPSPLMVPCSTGTGTTRKNSSSGNSYGGPRQVGAGWRRGRVSSIGAVADAHQISSLSSKGGGGMLPSRPLLYMQKQQQQALAKVSDGPPSLVFGPSGLRLNRQRTTSASSALEQSLYKSLTITKPRNIRGRPSSLSSWRTRRPNATSSAPQGGENSMVLSKVKGEPSNGVPSLAAGPVGANAAAGKWPCWFYLVPCETFVVLGFPISHQDL